MGVAVRTAEPGALRQRLEALRRSGVGGAERAQAALDLGRWRASLGEPRGLRALAQEARESGWEAEAARSSALWRALAAGRTVTGSEPGRPARPTAGSVHGGRLDAVDAELAALDAARLPSERSSDWLRAAERWEALGDDGLLRAALCRFEAAWCVLWPWLLGEVGEAPPRQLETQARWLEARGAGALHLAADLLLAARRGAAGWRDALEVLERAEQRGSAGLAWRAGWVAAVAARAAGDEAAGALHRRVLEVVDRVALLWGPAERAAFVARTELQALRGASQRGPARGAAVASADPGRSHHGSTVAERYERLLDVLARLASEQDAERLLERIVDSAVQLTGAERGLLLLVDEGGELSARTVRAGSGPAPSTATVDFSRSIAEAVLIDGEPIVTVDAQSDPRVGEYLSVHRLSLRSVAALPVQGRGEPLGVLYLEHRRRTGRFDEQAMDVLHAFTHQVAIALENARLLEELRRRGEELERRSEELRRAKEELERVLQARTEELQEARQELDRARGEAAERFRRHGIVARSDSMRRVLDTVERLADTAVPVVVQGESGTGKELVARAIHVAGRRAAKPFVALNCAAVPENLLESELFGHVRGAFTGADRDRKGVFERAHGGTLFLDEIADMPARMQVDLLRVLQEGRVRPVGGDREVEVDVRVVAASRRPLQQLVREGRFREDLYYRLAVVELSLPPLRERLEDVPLLCDHLLRRIAEAQGTEPRRLTRRALERLLAHDWPGNVRELEHVLLGACVLGSGPYIEPEDLRLPEGDGGDADGGARRAAAVRVVTVPVPVEVGGEGEQLVASVPPAADGQPVAIRREARAREQERARILEALEANGWNRSKAARALGIPRRTFYRRLKEYGIL